MKIKPALVLIGIFAVVAFCVVYPLNVSAAGGLCTGSYAHPGMGSAAGHGKSHSSDNSCNIAGMGSTGGYSKAAGNGLYRPPVSRANSHN